MIDYDLKTNTIFHHNQNDLQTTIVNENKNINK